MKAAEALRNFSFSRVWAAFALALVLSFVGAGQALAADDPPVANFTWSPAQPAVGVEVTFTSTSTRGDNPISTYTWQIQTNNQMQTVQTGSSSTLKYTFITPGPRDVRLIVKDTKGLTSTKTRNITIYAPPNANFDWSPASPTTSDTVTFTNRSTPGDGLSSISSQAWDTDNDGAFDDGTAATATKKFTVDGSHTVRLRVTDSRGNTAIASKVVTVAKPNQPPTASISYTRDTPGPNETVNFTGSGSDPEGGAVTYAWDLDNNGTFTDASGQTASTSFAAPGTYTVKLRVTDPTGLSTTASKVVTIYKPPTAAFDYSRSTPGPGETVTFDSSSSTDADGTIVSRSWDLNGDGTYGDATTSSASRSFPSPGTYTVGLRVVDSQGIASTTSKTVTVYQPPVASFDFTPAAPDSESQITFTSTATDADGQIVEQHWDLNGDGAYDDGSASTAQAKLAEGKHTVGLQVKDSQGIVSTVTRDVTVAKHQVVVTPNQPPSTRISSVSPNPVHVGERVTLTASSSDPEGGPVSESWDLNGDGQFGDATGPSATTTFSSPGAPVVAVRATDAGGASAVAFETVTVLPVAGPQPGGELQWLTPFPVVRISGTAFRNYTRIRRFSVLAPAGSRVVVSCHGRCGHARRFERRLSAAATVKTVRVRSFERKFSSGAVIEVAVTRGGYVGKYTRLRIRRLDSPARTDGCMLPGRAKPARCPARP